MIFSTNGDEAIGHFQNRKCELKSHILYKKKSLEYLDGTVGWECLTVVNHSEVSTVQLSEWLKWKIVTIPNTDKDIKKLDYSYIYDKNVKRYIYSVKTW